MAEGDTTGGSPAGGDTAGGRYTTPYALYGLLGTLGLATLVFLLLYFTGGLDNILKTALASLITLYGTLGGAYFGIKVTSDAADKSETGRRIAEAEARRAWYAAPPPEE
jgi:hypothetical protein